MKKILAVWSLLPVVMASFSAHAAEKKTPEQYWAGTGLSTDLTLRDMKLLSPATCYKTIGSFRGCLGAVNSLASRLEPVGRVVPNPIAAEPSFEFGAPVKRYIGVSLVNVPKSKDDSVKLREFWGKEEEKRKKVDAAVESLYQFRQLGLIDFEGIAQELLPRAVKDRGSDALVASEMVSAFLKEAVDAHARIEAAEELNNSLTNADESFAGAGLQIQQLEGKLIISAPIEGGPGAKVGLKPNDRIIAVDGKATDGMKIDEAVKLIKGPVGSTVKIKVNRNGQELEVAVVRDNIKQDNLETKVVSDFGKKIGVIKLRTFMDKSACQKMGRQILQLQNVDKVEGLVLDLRNNGGGLLDQAVCMGGLFFGQKTVVKVRDLQSDQFEEQKAPLPAATNLPMVTLIDAGSASASEVLSGALQDWERSWILGERSFGKGSVQAPNAFMGNPRIVIFQTIQRFYQPKGRTNQIVGIMPNFVRPAKPNATEDDRFFLREKDYYPNALGAESQAWVETRQGKVAKVEACVSASKLAEQKYAAATAASEVVDYQLLSAQEVLGCDK